MRAFKFVPDIHNGLNQTHIQEVSNNINIPDCGYPSQETEHIHFIGAYHIRGIGPREERLLFTRSHNGLRNGLKRHSQKIGNPGQAPPPRGSIIEADHSLYLPIAYHKRSPHQDSHEPTYQSPSRHSLFSSVHASQ
jgi:hypothetical protein